MKILVWNISNDFFSYDFEVCIKSVEMKWVKMYRKLNFILPTQKFTVN